VLEFENLAIGYNSAPVIGGVSATVRAGEVVSVLGINGAGKTTLLHGLIGFLPLYRGRVRLNGGPIEDRRPHEISHQGLAIVPQGRRIFRSLTVRENLVLAARGRPAGRWSIDSALELFPRLRERLTHTGNELSGGEQQMLAWARALVTNPAFILMDEPTEGLAPRFVRLLAELIPKLRADGLGILLAEQNIEFACDAADRVLILVHGRFSHEYSRAELNAMGAQGRDAIKTLGSVVQGLS